jgi:hypothetical protein
MFISWIRAWGCGLEAQFTTDRKLHKVISRELKWFVPLLVETAARLGLSHRLRYQPSAMESMVTGRTRTEKLKVLEVRYNQAAIYVRIDPTRLPYGIAISNLRDPDVLETLSHSLQRNVEFSHDPISGLWYTINRDEATRGIPNEFPFKHALDFISGKEKASSRPIPPLYFVAGVGENYKVYGADLVKAPHALIAGLSGSGKSVMLNSIMCQFLLRNSPQHLRLNVIDLKAGVEFYDYRFVPHIDRIITEPADVTALLEELIKTIKDRLATMRGYGRDLSQFNTYRESKGEEPLPYIVLIIDELAEVTLDKSHRLDSMTALTRVLQIGRAAGIHALLCTQSPYSQVVDALIKNNAAMRFSFQTATNAQSIAVIDSKDSAELSSPGRVIFSFGTTKKELQTPYCKPFHVRQTIKFIEKKYGLTGTDASSTEFEMPDQEPWSLEVAFRYSLTTWGGAFSARTLHAVFAEQIGYVSLANELQRTYGTKICIDDLWYYVKKGKGKRPSSLIRTDPPSENMAAD